MRNKVNRKLLKFGVWTKIEEYQAKIPTLENRTKSHLNLESAKLKEMEEDLRKERDVMKEEKENLLKKVGACELQISTFQSSKEQDLKTELPKTVWNWKS